MDEFEKEMYKRQYLHEREIAESWGCEKLMTYEEWLGMKGIYNL